VDHLLRAHPLTSSQASVAERRGGSGGSLSALTHNATTPAITTFPRAMACTLASPCCVLNAMAYQR